MLAGGNHPPEFFRLFLRQNACKPAIEHGRLHRKGQVCFRRDSNQRRYGKERKQIFGRKIPGNVRQPSDRLEMLACNLDAIVPNLVNLLLRQIADVFQRQKRHVRPLRAFLRGKYPPVRQEVC